MIRNFDVIGGDLITGPENFIEGTEETANSLYHRLRLFLGEYFLDTTVGTPWFQQILGKSSDDLAEAAVKAQIISAPRVVILQDFSFDRDGRKISISASVLDVDNQLVQIAIDEDLING